MLDHRLFKKADAVNEALIMPCPDPRTDTKYDHEYAEGTEPERNPGIDIGRPKISEAKMHGGTKVLAPRMDAREYMDEDEKKENLADSKTSSLTDDQKKKVEMEFRADPGIIEEAKASGKSVDDLWSEFGSDVLDQYYHSGAK